MQEINLINDKNNNLDMTDKVKADKVLYVAEDTRERFKKVMNHKGFSSPNDFLLHYVIIPIEAEMKAEEEKKKHAQKP